MKYPFHDYSFVTISVSIVTSSATKSFSASIIDLGVRNIFYTTNDGYAHEKLEKYEVGVAA
mgnify:CR=1 FL=1